MLYVRDKVRVSYVRESVKRGLEPGGRGIAIIEPLPGNV
jgi:hypothetical protein